ncbi:MAG: hypothetical protein IKR74_02305 [Bacilli bacterium]|nr:hypothetical protein [Bacilli bacterium]
MTYYELVNYLDDMITSPISDNDIDKIANADISLNGRRYDRFIVQVNYFMTERLGYILDNTISKIKNSTFSSDELALEMSIINNEIKLLKKFINVKHIKEENREAFKLSLKNNVNNMLGSLKSFFIDEEKIRIINQYVIKENEKDEL